MYGLEEVVKKGDKVVRKSKLYKGKDMVKLKNVMSVCICKHSVSYKSRDGMCSLYIRRDGNYAEFVQRDKGRRFEYLVKENGKCKEAKTSLIY